MEDPLVVTYSDSSHGNGVDLSSYYGVAIRMCGALSSGSAFSGWQVHPSTRDAELIAAVKGLHCLLVARILLAEVRLPRTLPLCIGSSATVAGTTNDQIHHDSRYAAIRIEVLRQAVCEELCQCMYTNSARMIAGILTKELTRESILNFYDAVYGFCRP